jgi:5-methyltetrahydropteroyltriglutamate--homocysteine methyltransferase
MSEKTVRADHVGSLLRPARLIDALEQETGFRHDQVRPSNASLEFANADQDAIREVTDECIREVVAKQEAIGLDSVTDGEFRRVFFMGSLDQAVSGFAPSDMTIEFHNETDKIDVEGRPVVVDRLEVIGTPAADEARFTSSITDKPVKVTFPAASSQANPSMFVPGVTDKHYADFTELAMHLGQIMRGQIDAAIEAGATVVQLDYPAYPLLLDPHFEQMMGAEGTQQALEGALMADAMIVQGIPDHVTTALHLCRGNLRGMWMADARLDPIAERFFALPYDLFLVEWDDTSRMGDYSALKAVPAGPTVAMGLVSTKNPELEDEDELVRHLEEAAQHVDVGQLALCPQCGFASEAGGNDLTEDQQWAKLELVRRVADRVWG